MTDLRAVEIAAYEAMTNTALDLAALITDHGADHPFLTEYRERHGRARQAWRDAQRASDDHASIQRATDRSIAAIAELFAEGGTA